MSDREGNYKKQWYNPLRIISLFQIEMYCQRNFIKWIKRDMKCNRKLFAIFLFLKQGRWWRWTGERNRWKKYEYASRNLLTTTWGGWRGQGAVRRAYPEMDTRIVLLFSLVDVKKKKERNKFNDEFIKNKYYPRTWQSESGHVTWTLRFIRRK